MLDLDSFLCIDCIVAILLPVCRLRSARNLEHFGMQACVRKIHMHARTHINARIHTHIHTHTYAYVHVTNP
jgi:hypothetical protein